MNEEAPEQIEQSPEQTTATTQKACDCPTVHPADWDKKRFIWNKSFFKTFSPRIFYFPFSFAIDLLRAKRGAEKAGCKVKSNPMILDTGAMFLSTIMVELEHPAPSNKNVVSFNNKEVYTKTSSRPWKELKTDIAELDQELGQKPKELYLWWTSCPKCTEQKEVKTILIAIQGDASTQAAPVEATQPPAAAPAETIQTPPTTPPTTPPETPPTP